MADALVVIRVVVYRSGQWATVFLHVEEDVDTRPDWEVFCRLIP